MNAGGVRRSVGSDRARPGTNHNRMLFGGDESLSAIFALWFCQLDLGGTDDVFENWLAFAPLASTCNLTNYLELLGFICKFDW
ncbi:hypothetical protein KR51_00010860 [Rubidibacter lacunae KORDI 51-2]|uniref:Uncharacterized protein n=1 Tax=Rubidibacter lacunae KORDI 51-2 TaxID=582515 RepID=U5DMU3_9CHRO|nr:hypothetical protein [Rubidibacter lacunae]ERN42157.1 hypothetical protein KR51_00010860 [Rubidibacter lacunae KORDI 51-2]